MDPRDDRVLEEDWSHNTKVNFIPYIYLQSLCPVNLQTFPDIVFGRNITLPITEFDGRQVNDNLSVIGR